MRSRGYRERLRELDELNGLSEDHCSSNHEPEQVTDSDVSDGDCGVEMRDPDATRQRMTYKSCGYNRSTVGLEHSCAALVYDSVYIRFCVIVNDHLTSVFKCTIPATEHRKPTVTPAARPVAGGSTLARIVDE